MKNHHQIFTITVEMDGKEYWRRYCTDKGKVPKVARDDLQVMINDLFEYHKNEVRKVRE